MVSRIWPKFHYTHVWFGRTYIVGMFYSFASSILIHNTGLPLPIMFFFVILLLSLAIGWISIKFHENVMMKESYTRVDGMLNYILESRGVDDNIILEKLNLIEPTKINLLQLVNSQKSQIASEKTFTQRLFSFKALHGMMMALSWWQLFGNAMARNVFHEFTCWTQPAWKNVTNGVVEFVPLENPDYKFSAPGAEMKFFSLVSAGTISSVIIVGILYSYFAARNRTIPTPSSNPK